MFRWIEGAHSALAPADPVELLGAAGFDVSGCDRLSFTVTNDNAVGSNPLTGLGVYWCDESSGTRWRLDSNVAFAAPVTKGAADQWTFSGLCHRRMRIVVTSDLGTGVTLDLFGQGAP